MSFFKPNFLLLFLLIATGAQDSLLAIKSLRSMMEMPLTTSVDVPTPIVSACGPNKVENINHVCIKPEYIEGC